MTVSGDIIEDRAMKLVSQHKKDPTKRIIQEIDDNKFIVRFTYLVTNEWSCQCGWFINKGECKHIKSVKYCIENNIYIPKSDSK